MKHILEYRKYALLPKKLRSMNLLYHSTYIDYFEKIMRDDEIFGSDMYDYGIATSRNKHYAFGHGEKENDYKMHNQGNVQIILDKDKIKNVCKIKAFDWEEMKSNKAKTGKYQDYHQAEDKIYCKDNTLKNLSKYIVGLHIVHNEYKMQVFKILNDLEINTSNWYIFDENWDIIYDY